MACKTECSLQKRLTSILVVFEKIREIPLLPSFSFDAGVVSLFDILIWQGHLWHRMSRVPLNEKACSVQLVHPFVMRLYIWGKWTPPLPRGGNPPMVETTVSITQRILEV